MTSDSPRGHILARFIRRLRMHSDLSDVGAQSLRELPAKLVKRDRLSYVTRQGDDLQHCAVLVSGFVERHRVSEAGKKQILSFYLPGDPLNLESIFLRRSDDALQTTKFSELALIQCSDLRDLMRRQPEIMNAIVRSLLVDASIFREWTFNVGQRDARSRIAHLLCELAFRMEAQDLREDGILLPLTQVNIADATGLTSIHVNRTLRAMQSEGMLTYKPGAFQLLDWRRLAEVADFSSGYLHSENQMGDEAEPA